MVTEILGAFYKANAPLSRRRWAGASGSSVWSAYRAAIRGGSEW